MPGFHWQQQYDEYAYFTNGPISGGCRVVVVKLYFLFGQMVPKEVPRQCWMLTHREGSI